MPFCQFIDAPARGLFGSFPSQDEIEKLVFQENVKIVVNLTEENEAGTKPYTLPLSCEAFSFPIKDNHAPEMWLDFAKFVVRIVQRLKKGQNVFIHCRAGHGRSGMMATSILCYLDSTLHPERAINMISAIHSKRDGLSEKWSHVFNPLSRLQHIFIYKFFSTIYLTRAYHIGSQRGFSSFSPHPIQMSNLSFPNTEAAFQYFKDPKDNMYVRKLQDVKKFMLIKLIGDNHRRRQKLDINQEEMMYYVFKIKYEQYPDLVEPLLNTGLKRIFDGYLYSHPDNLIGRVLMRLREEFIENMLQ